MPFVMPEFLVLNCLLPRLCGANILMDWEDPSREVFLAKYPGREQSTYMALLTLFERLSVSLACEIITPNEGFRRAFAERSLPREKIPYCHERS